MEEVDRARLSEQVRAKQIRNGMLANLAGALFAFAFLGFLVPVAPDYRHVLRHNTARSAVVLAAYMPIALVLGLHWMNRVAAPMMRWLKEDRPPTEAERRVTLSLPLEQAKVAACFWGAAAILFTLVNLSGGWRAVVNTAVVLLGGLTTSAITYLLA